MGFLRFCGTALLTLCTAFCLAQLKGFSQDGQNWTYEEGDWKIRGVLIKPEGEGPFPAILVSHGYGSTASNFAPEKAREFAKWGLVSIAVDYTHARGGSGDSKSHGASPENLKRALKCLEILRSLKYVDGNRIGAYGNSMGAFLTIALSAKPEAKLRCAAITAGGISGAPGFPAPDASVAKGIKAPLAIFHGDSDNVVRAKQSEDLKKVLDEQKVENLRMTFPGEGHNLHRSKADEVYKAMREWFTKHKLLVPQPS